MTFRLWYKSNHDFCAFAARNRAEFGKCRNKKGMQMKQKGKIMATFVSVAIPGRS